MKKHGHPTVSKIWISFAAGVGLLLISGFLLVPAVQSILYPRLYIHCDTPTLTVENATVVDGEIDLQPIRLVRGQPVRLISKGETSSLVQSKGETFSIDNQYLSRTLKDAIFLSTVYPQRRINLRSEPEGKLDARTVSTTDALTVRDIQPQWLDAKTGELRWIEIEQDGKSWYVPGTAISSHPKKSARSDLENECDLRGYAQPDFEDNPRLQQRRGLHATLETMLNHENELVEYMHQAGMNCVVLAVKGVDGQVWYSSDVPSLYYHNDSDMSQKALASKEELKELVERLHQEGLYVIARLETFQDSHLAADSPELAVTDARGRPALISGSYWLSPYLRSNWMYAIDLAEEAAEAGFNEVQFDFCRFPDTPESMNSLDWKNEYDETEAQAIQNFLFTAREQLEPRHVYTAVDMFAGPVYENSDYSIGQYYPALLASSNVVCPMAYLETLQFLPENSGIEVFSQADDVMNRYTSLALTKAGAQDNAADVCLWLQGFGLMSPSTLKAQIEGVEKAGADSWLLWSDEGDMDLLLPLIKAFENDDDA